MKSKICSNWYCLWVSLSKVQQKHISSNHKNQIKGDQYFEWWWNSGLSTGLWPQKYFGHFIHISSGKMECLFKRSKRKNNQGVNKIQSNKRRTFYQCDGTMWWSNYKCRICYHFRSIVSWKTLTHDSNAGSCLESNTAFLPRTCSINHLERKFSKY